MKIIWENTTETISATDSESGFPASNMLNEHSKKRWKSGVSSTTVTATLQGGSNALAMYNLTADSAKVTVDGTEYNFTLLQDDGWGEYRLNSFFLDYGEVVGTHDATIELSISGDDVACGIFFSGVSYDWVNPRWGASTGAKSHSIVYDLDNGFEYIFQRNLSKTPSLSMQPESKEEYFNFMRWAEAIYPDPFLLYIENFSEELTYYARMESLPKGLLSSFNNYKIDFSLKEFL
jgi:hypothetical protein